MFVESKIKFKSKDDPELVHLYCQKGDLEALGALYQRYTHLVYGVCLKYLKHREESQDALMQIFEKLVEKTCDQEVKNFKSWLYVVARNHCLTVLKKRQSIEKVENEFMENTLGSGPIGEESEGGQAFELATALSTLPDHQARCVKLFYYENMSYLEIVSETGYELKKVKSYIQNGKRNLKNYLSKNGR